MPSRWILCLMLAFTLAIGTMTTGVWASTSDPEMGAGSLSNGTLDLTLSASGSGPVGKTAVTDSGVDHYVVFSNVTPGNSGWQEWTLTDVGSIVGTLRMTVSSTVTFTSNPSPNELQAALSNPAHDNVNGNLSSYMGVKLQVGTGANYATAEAALSYLYGNASYYYPFSGLQAILNGQTQLMDPPDNANPNCVVYRLSWILASPIMGAGPNGYFGGGDDTTVGQQIVEGDNVSMNITFALVQQ